MKSEDESAAQVQSGVTIHWAGMPFAIFLIAVVLFYIAALYSWTPLDESPFSVTIPPVSPKNFGGVYGAWLSGVMIYYCGWLAWLIPFPLLIMSTRVVLSSPSFLSQLTGFIKGSLVFSGLFLFMVLVLDMTSPYGKMAGMMIPVAGSVGEALSGFVETHLGQVGVLLLVILLPPWLLFFSTSHQKRARIFKRRKPV